MTTLTELQQYYITPLKLSDEMLACARQQQWDGLIALYNQYIPLLQKAMDLTLEVSAQTDEVADIMQNLLTNERLIRELSKGRLEELTDNMAQLNETQTGNQAYRAQSRQSH
ncbi:flagellar protein FliT [Biostraticola tofi]|uniref:Flagellar protein FliT n=1 Tax=Biostraticola tofi TaxID=466109 RepID=A0A4R3YVX7_9GAMM|nr:flagellar protein FliT [Biostraticola tofi]TCV95564.1 protein FliT [Biostraticola tofi]